MKKKSSYTNFFGYSKLIIADGIDQFVRGTEKINWGKNIYVTTISEKRSLRQKRNLATFVNDYASQIDLKWHVDILPELMGGKVTISKKLLPFDVFDIARERCYAQGNKAFEMLFLTPPNYVKGKSGERRFAFLEEFRDNGFKLWDGTNNDIRANSISTINQHRLLQYDSCRGLEGWCVVCLGFDKMVEYREGLMEREYKDDHVNNELIAMDSEEAKILLVGLWSLIPLTRAIDTLIITLSDRESKTSNILNNCANLDYVEIIE